MTKNKKWIQELFSLADIKVRGGRPWDIEVCDERFYNRVVTGGSLALGESYMDGWWEVKELDQFFYKILVADLEEKVDLSWNFILSNAKAFVFNLQSRSRAFIVGEKHYDIGNDLYKAMLDGRLVYTCGYWKEAKDLNEAQEAKLDLVCRKIGLKSGEKVLDIGCGWGSFLKFAAEKYNASGVGITVSKEQAELAKGMLNDLPIDIRIEDYRDIKEKFDKVVSLGMFEHVGYKNYRTYMKKVSKVLKDEGLFLLHTIGSNKSDKIGDPWIHKYIFPNGLLPSITQIGKSIEKVFVMEDWHNFGADYDQTLMAWFHNFDKAWPELSKNYSEKFYRMWKYYLLSCAGGFRSRKLQLWQIVLSKKGVLGGCQSAR